MLDPTDFAAGRINLLRTGLAYADRITTVSPTYARELHSAEYGMGLEGLLRKRTDAIVGILNGVDYDEWDPRRDRYVTRNYGANQLGVKAEIKDEFLQRIRLTGGARLALIGIVSRLATQKGFDLLFDSMPRLLQSREFNLVVLGTGEQRYEDFFNALQRRFPDRVHFERRYSDELAHWIEAASDMFLMPSRYEPCGLNQMYSMRYGTVPIVRRTGRLGAAFRPRRRLGHRHRIQRLQRRGGHLGPQYGARPVPEPGHVAPADAEWHGAGLLLEPPGARLRGAV
jgi:starch synthase